MLWPMQIYFRDFLNYFLIEPSGKCMISIL